MLCFKNNEPLFEIKISNPAFCLLFNLYPQQQPNYWSFKVSGLCLSVPVYVSPFVLCLCALLSKSVSRCCVSSFHRESISVETTQLCRSAEAQLLGIHNGRSHYAKVSPWHILKYCCGWLEEITEGTEALLRRSALTSAQTVRSWLRAERVFMCRLQR